MSYERLDNDCSSHEELDYIIDESNEECAYPLRPDSFDLEEGDGVHSGDDYCSPEYRRRTAGYIYEQDSEPDDIPTMYTVLKKGSRHFGDVYSSDQVESLAEQSGLSFYKYCERYDIVSITPFMDSELDASTAAIRQIELTEDPTFIPAEIRHLRFAIDIAYCMDTISGVKSMVEDIDDALLKVLRLGSIHNDPKPNDQEAASIEGFKKKICGPENAINRHNCLKAIDEYLKNNS